MNKTTIAEACELHARIGWQGLTKKEYLDEGDYYLVTGVDFVKGHIDFAGCHYVTKDRYDQDAHIQLRLNDVLVTKDGTIGKVAIIDAPIDKPATLNSGVFVVRPRNPDKLLPKFLMLALLSNNFNAFIDRIKVGCTIAHLNQEKFLNYEFPLPSVSEQLQAIEAFNKLFTVLNNRQQQLSALDDLIKARFVEMFGDPFSNPLNWECISFKESSLRLSDGPFGSNLKSEHYSETGVRVIRLGNIGVGRFIDEDKSFIPPEHYENLKKYTCHAGEIVIGTLGDPNLRACIIPKEIGIAVNKADCVHYIPDPSLLNTEFACQYVNCPETLLLAHGMIHGQTRSRVSSGQIAEMPIFIPPLELQNVFSDFVHQIDKSKSAVQKSLDETQRLFDSLMQKYFG